jgi:hypothetical protein
VAAQVYCGCCSDTILPGDGEAVCWACDDRNSDNARAEGVAEGRAAAVLDIMAGVGGFEKSCDYCDRPIILLPRKASAKSRASRWTAWNHDGTRHRGASECPEVGARPEPQGARGKF